MSRSLLSVLFLSSVAAFSPPMGSLAARRHTPAARMMFGGDKEGDGNFMDKLKARSLTPPREPHNLHGGLSRSPLALARARARARATPRHAGGQGHVQPRDDEEVL